MSIIHNALKKTQDSLNDKTKKPTPENKKGKQKDAASIYQKMHNPTKPKDEEPKETPKKIESHAKKNLFIIIAIIIVLALIAGMVYIPKIPFFKELRKKSIRQSYRPRLDPKTGREYLPGEIVLTGTTMMGSRTVALINNRIFEQGEIVHDQEIINITIDSVELKNTNTGKIKTLQVGK